MSVLGVIGLFVMICAGSIWLGLRVLVPLLRPAVDPDLPPARVANSDGAERAYQKATDVASREGRKLGTVLGIALGLVLILWPIGVVVWWFTTSARIGIGSL